MIRWRPPLAALVLALAAVPAGAFEIVPVTSPGGVAAWLAEDHSVPIVALQADFRGGAALDPQGREGAMSMMAALLEEGSAGRDATAFAEAVETLGARFHFGAGADSVSVGAQMLADTLPPAADLLRDALQAPRFDADAVARVRAQAVANLENAAHDPDALAARAFDAAAFPGHPYARHETPESVAAVAPEDLRAALRSGLVRDRLTVAVAGAITPGELAPLLDRLFAGLPLADRPLPGAAEPTFAGGLQLVDVDVPQSSVRFGQPGLARADPDFIPAVVLDHILGGGGFGSRLTAELRERRGLTYGVSTWLDTADLGPVYGGAFASANGRVAEAVGLVRAEWARMAAEGVTDAELADAKRYLTGAFPLRFVGTDAIARQLAGIQRAGLGLDYIDRRNALVEAVTRDDVARVARRLLDPDALTFVVAGRPAGLESAD